MPFEARNTKFTVISSNHELYNLIKSEFQHEIRVEIKNKQTHVENRREELIDKFLKAYIVLNGLNKNFLSRESSELQNKTRPQLRVREHSACCQYVNYRPEATELKLLPR